MIAFGHKTTAVVCAIGLLPDLQRKSVSKVVAVIQGYGSGISQKEIIFQTGLSERSVKYALALLENSEVIVALCLLNDLRRKIYTPKVNNK